MMLKGLKFKSVGNLLFTRRTPTHIGHRNHGDGLHNPDKTGITPEVSAKMIAAGIFASLLYPSLARRLLKGDTPDVESTIRATLNQRMDIK